MKLYVQHGGFVMRFDFWMRLQFSWLSLCLSVRLTAWNNSAPTGRIFIQFYI